MFVWPGGLFDFNANVFVNNIVSVRHYENLPKSPNFHGLYPINTAHAFPIT